MLYQWFKNPIIKMTTVGYIKETLGNIIDLIPDQLHYRLFLCHTHHFDGQISIALNGINNNGSLFYMMHEAEELILHC